LVNALRLWRARPNVGHNGPHLPVAFHYVVEECPIAHLHARALPSFVCVPTSRHNRAMRRHAVERSVGTFARSSGTQQARRANRRPPVDARSIADSKRAVVDAA